MRSSTTWVHSVAVEQRIYCVVQATYNCKDRVTDIKKFGIAILAVLILHSLAKPANLGPPAAATPV
jgi:hypothetical protein